MSEFKKGDKVVYLYPSIRKGIYEIVGRVINDSVWIKTPIGTLIKERTSYLMHANQLEIEQGFRDE